MREIKFRVWDDKNKKWLLGYEYENLGGFHIDGETVMLGEWSHILNQRLQGEFGEKGEHLKIMQYTNIKDRDGEDIYEGDIVTDYLHTEKFEIRYSEEYGSYLAFHLEREDAWVSLGHAPEYLKIKVIGNIYEDPEL